MPGGTCVFLARLGDGTTRCGLGALRPAACRVFPARDDGGAILLEAAGCTCDWTGVAIDDAARRELAELREARKRYAGVVARWNAYVLSQVGSAKLVPRDFGRFLLDAYPE